MRQILAACRMLRQPRSAATLSVCMLVGPVARSADPPPSPAGTDPDSQDPVSIAAFIAPRAKEIARPNCDDSSDDVANGAEVRPGNADRIRLNESSKKSMKVRSIDSTDACKKLQSGIEGWVELGFMVDTSGKPFEITVLRSTGDGTFDAIGVQALEQSTFYPGMLNGTPVESGYEFKYSFYGYVGGPRSKFIATYEALLKAVGAGDRKAADAALANLKITSMSEDAYYGLAKYFYACKWGDEQQQLEALGRAIVREDRATYLPSDQFKSALATRLNLEMKGCYYAEALKTWQGLEKLGVDANTKALFQPTVDRLQTLRLDTSSYTISGWLNPEGSWHLRLFKRHFQAVVSDGYISQVKLRCDTHYVYFDFDPSLQYNVNPKYGSCSIELLGTPGAHFQLVQS
jgi:hypothetical protein